MFGSEEERKKKEKKSFVVITSVLSALSSIVTSLPCIPGEPLVTVWGQILVDTLCDLLSHSNTDIKLISATTLATFCSICSGGGRVETVPYESNVRFSILKSRDEQMMSVRGEKNERNEKNNFIKNGRSGEGDNGNVGGNSDKNDNNSADNEEGKEGKELKELKEGKEEDREETKEEGAWLIESCLGRLSAGLSSSFEKKGASCEMRYMC